MKVLAVLSLFLAFFISNINAQPAWEARLDGKARFYQTTEFGVLLAATDNSLFALDAESGATLWRRRHKGLDETAIAPVPGTDLILLTLDEGSRSRLEAVDLLSGAGIWRTERVRGDVLQLAVEPEQDLIAAVMVRNPKGKAGGEVKRKPAVHVFRLSSGEELWKKELGSEIELLPSRFDDSGDVAFTLDNYRAPLIVDGRLFLFYEGATSYDARTGGERVREKFKVNENGLALTEADPVINEKYVFTTGRGKVRAVSRRTGEVEWEAKDLGVTPEMAIVGNVLYVRTGGQFTRLKDGETEEKGSFGVSAIDAGNGKTLWRWKGADKGLTNFVFRDENTILVADKDDLTTLDARTGKRLAKIAHKIEKAQFVLINERGEAVIGGRDELAAFSISNAGFQNASFAPSEFNPKSQIPNPKLLWRIEHRAPRRGVLRTIAGIALRATALYFRYGGLATSTLNLYRGASVARAVLNLRWSGLAARFSSVDLTALATSAAKNYAGDKIRVFGVSANRINSLRRLPGLQISDLPTPESLRGRIADNLVSRATPSRSEVQESLLDRLDPARQVERLSEYFLRRKRFADLRGNFMYFYTDLPAPFDKKGLIGVSVHTGRDVRFVPVSELDARFVTDETAGLLYTADGNRLQAFSVLAR